MPTVADLVQAIESIAPLSYAEEWDKVGLLVGDRERALKGPVLLTIDLTEGVLAEAVAMHAGFVVAYHPPIWDELRRVTADTPRQRIILRAIESGMAVYTPHTALDAVPGGVADWLCEGLSGSAVEGKIEGDCRALTPHGKLEFTQQVKVVTFIPEEKLDAARNALASAGAGIIGGYQLCSFTSRGTGTFFGCEQTNPSVGRAGRIEQVPECRLEMVCSRAALPLALETLHRFHPYELPAIDVYPLEAQPVRTIGPGRRLVLDRPATVAEIAERFKKTISRERVRVAMLGDDRPITHIGVCPGSGASMARRAREEGAQLYVTGEMGHHDVIASLHSGMAVMVGGHTSTERGYLPRLRSALGAKMPGMQFVVSKVDADPMTIV